MIQLSANQEQLLGNDNCVVRMDEQFVSAQSMQADIRLAEVNWK